MQETSETQVRSLGQEDPLEEDMATQSSICAWRIPMEGGAWRAYSPWGHKELDKTERLNTFTLPFKGRANHHGEIHPLRRAYLHPL